MQQRKYKHIFFMTYVVSSYSNKQTMIQRWINQRIQLAQGKLRLTMGKVEISGKSNKWRLSAWLLIFQTADF